MMHRIFAVLVMTVMSAGGAVAQTDARMLIGVSGNTLYGHPDISAEPIYRLAGGGGLSYWIKPSVGVRTELRYTIQGGKLDGTVEGFRQGEPTDIPVDATFDLTYLEVPFMGMLGFDTGRGRVEFAAGPGLSIKVDTRSTFSAKENNDGLEFNQSVAGTKRVWGLSAAVDYLIPVRGERLILGLRFWRATTSAGLEDSVVEGDRLKTTGITLLSGISF